jgi:L,D-transpeptidase YcbB
MRVIVGSPKDKTPMMAVRMTNARVDPYWNVPPDMIARMTAQRVLKQGVSYLKNFHYEVLSDWTLNARLVDPKVDWKKVAAGKSDIRVRQLAGTVEFDGPDEVRDAQRLWHLSARHSEQGAVCQADRWISNGCVRLEDYKRFASWLFGTVPQGRSGREEVVNLREPVPVFMTYLTVKMHGNGVQFRPDPYGFDDQAMRQMFGPGVELAAAY